MGSNSKIEWCDHTFNPWIGCTKVSEGCKHCYAEQLMDKRWNKVQWGPQGKRVKTSDANWAEPLRWNKQAGQLGIRYRVFCASLADVFDDHPSVQSTWRRDLFFMMAGTPNLDWLILTKRPENFHGQVPWSRLPMNIWVGTSVENQEQAEKRIPRLLDIPAKVKFLSMEPLLGDVKLNNGIDWVIVGGESGTHARPMHPDWARSVRDQCQAAGVKFFFKQWGEYAPVCNETPMPLSKAKVGETLVLMRPDGQILSGGDVIGPDTVAMWRAGKKVAGRELDGREWDEMPV